MLLDRLLKGGAEPVGVDARARLDRGQHRVVGGWSGEGGLDLRDRLGDRELGGHPALGHALADAVAQLAEVGADPGELGRHRAGDVVVGHGEQAHQQGQRALEAVHRVGGEPSDRGLGQVGRRDRGGRDDAPGQPLLIVETVVAEGVRAGREVAQQGGVGLIARARGILEAAHVGVVAEHVPPGRVLVEDRLPVVVRQTCEIVVHAGVLPSRWWSVRQPT